MTRGILLINLGTPDGADVQAVRRYLKEFLSDPRVIDLPAPLRWILLNVFILPFRPKQSAHAYQSIWTDLGSPLLLYSQELAKKLGDAMAGDYTVVLGMRYGNPDLGTALSRLKHCDHITILPLYPQYASSSTGSSLEAVLKQLAGNNNLPNLSIIRDFHTHPGFINAQAKLIKQSIQNDYYVLFSYHGVPERHIHKGGCASICVNNCPVPAPNSACYRGQCFATTAALVTEVGLEAHQFSSSFQSRLGKTPWIKPYTDEVLPELYNKGIRKLAVCCPSFVADCLETIEEIGIRAREQWQNLGGESFTLIPCVNTDPLWIQGIQAIIDAKPTHNSCHRETAYNIS